jgi:hypothetical protein
LTAAEKRRGPFHVSLFTGEFVGAKCLLSAILYKLGKKDEAYYHAGGLIATLEEACLDLPPSDCEVMYGRAGALQAIWFLRQELEDPTIGRNFSLATSQAILIEGLKNGREHETESLLMWKWREKAFLGASHGAVGILHSLLGHSEEEWTFLEDALPRVKDVVRQAIDSLQGLRHPSGNLRATLDGFEEDKYTDWSHGSPGYCLLLVKAAEVFHDIRYLEHAKDMAERVLWPRRVQRKGLGLIRGISGIAYVFLALARADRPNAEMWRARAEHYALAAADDLRDLLTQSNRPYSLCEGLGGLVSLLMDLGYMETAHFPFYETHSKKRIVEAHEVSQQVSVKKEENIGETTNTPKHASKRNIEAKAPLTKSPRTKTPEKPRHSPITATPDAAPRKSGGSRNTPKHASKQIIEAKPPLTKSPRTKTPEKPRHSPISATSDAAPRKSGGSRNTPKQASKQINKAKPPLTKGPRTKAPEKPRSRSTEKTCSAMKSESGNTPSDESRVESSMTQITSITSPQNGDSTELVVTPLAIKRFLAQASPARETPSPVRLTYRLQESLVSEEDVQSQHTLLAQEFINACLRKNTSEGNLYSGGIGPWVFLQMRLTQHLMRNPHVCRIKSMKPLKSAREAVVEALKDAETRRGTFHPSILTGEWVGAKCLMASVLYNSGDAPAARKHASDVVSRLEHECAKLPSMECDVLYGRAGVLQSIWYLRQELDDPEFGRDLALSTSLSILMEGLKTAQRKNNGWLLLWEWRGEAFLGAANGVAGILHSILGHSPEELDLLEQHLPGFRGAIQNTIINLHRNRHPSGNLRATLDGNEEDRFFEWAHGAPGYCLLLIRAAEVLGEPQYIEIAKEIADTVLWPRRQQRMGVGLSRGMSGVGYVFLGLARVDSENHAIWKERTEYYVEAAVSNWGELMTLSSRPYSLYEGLGGLVSLMLDLENMESGHFPFFETKPKPTGIAAPAGKETSVVKFAAFPKQTKKATTPKASDDLVTATTASSTALMSPEKAPNRSPTLSLLSPLTDPFVTPTKERYFDKSPGSSDKTGSGSKVFPAQRKTQKHTITDYAPLAARETASSRAKTKRGTPYRPEKGDSPTIRRLVGGFGDAHHR